MPIGFLGCMCVMIWRRGYIPSMNGISARDKSMRELSWYFFRIIAVFVGFWLPTMIVSLIGISNNTSWVGPVFSLLVTIQPIASTCMAMTKSDVKKYIFDLITLSYIRTTKSQEHQSNIDDRLCTGMASAGTIGTTGTTGTMRATRTSTHTSSTSTEPSRVETTSSLSDVVKGKN